MIWHQTGGAGGRTVLLLHGAGATAGVWHGVIGALNDGGSWRWIAADLSGHGGSDWDPPYGVEQLAEGVADVVRESRVLFVVGHSLGAYVALRLAAADFALQVRGVLGLGPKINWSDAELQAAREQAARPPRWYASAAEAWSRYRRVSGLGIELVPDEAPLARGVVHEAAGWRLAQDPRTFAAAGACFAALVAGAGPTELLLARGAHDPLVSLAELRSHSARACDIKGAGHNAHVENAGAVLQLLEQLSARAGAA
jgi:pimeloyl-ACP methyl ester carboxylesterase